MPRPLRQNQLLRRSKWKIDFEPHKLEGHNETGRRTEADCSETVKIAAKCQEEYK